MAKKRKGDKPEYRNSYTDYYDEENRRESERERIRFHSYTESPQRPAAQPKAQSGGAARRRKKRRKQSRYRLAHPEKLLFMLGMVAIAVVLLVIWIRSSGGGKEENEESAAAPIQTIQSGQEAQETGTLRPVSYTDLNGMPKQLAAYMASMVNVNPENYKKDPNQLNEQDLPGGQQGEDTYLFSVAIDAGHGGTDAGWTVGAAEKDITLKMAEKVNSYINHNAPEYHSFLIRSSDAVMSDQQRVTRAEQGYADLIISLHCNGSEMELGGTSAAYWTGEGDDDTRAAHSQTLAESLMEAAAEGFGMWERETRVEDNPLLHTQVPSVMLEMGYLTYDYDNELLQDEELQDEAAAKIGQVIIDYMKEVAPVADKDNKLSSDSSVSPDDSGDQGDSAAQDSANSEGEGE